MTKACVTKIGIEQPYEYNEAAQESEAGKAC